MSEALLCLISADLVNSSSKASSSAYMDGTSVRAGLVVVVVVVVVVHPPTNRTEQSPGKECTGESGEDWGSSALVECNGLGSGRPK